jgi:hypothetical protein
MLRKAADRIERIGEVRHLILSELKASEERFGTGGPFSMEKELSQSAEAHRLAGHKTGKRNRTE